MIKRNWHTMYMQLLLSNKVEKGWLTQYIYCLFIIDDRRKWTYNFLFTKDDRRWVALTDLHNANLLRINHCRLLPLQWVIFLNLWINLLFLRFENVICLEKKWKSLSTFQISVVRDGGLLKKKKTRRCQNCIALCAWLGLIFF